MIFLLLKRLAFAQQQDCHREEEAQSQASMPVESNALVLTDNAQARPTMPADMTSHDDAICVDLQLPVLGLSLSERSPMVSSTNEQAYISAFSLGATFWANDATNSSMWQRKKLQGLLVHSSVMVDWSALLNENYVSAFRTHKAMSLSFKFCNSFLFTGFPFGWMILIIWHTGTQQTYATLLFILTDSL